MSLVVVKSSEEKKFTLSPGHVGVGVGAGVGLKVNYR